MSVQRVVPVAVLLLLAAALRADTLVLKDGRTFEGRIVRRQADKVVFEVHQGQSKFQLVLPTAQVADVRIGVPSAPDPAPAEPPAATAPIPAPTSQPPAAVAGSTYYVIPIKDIIGVYVTADTVEKALKEASRQKPSVVILEVDSDGGSTETADQIVNLLADAKDLRTVAYVRKAISAAAVVTMACQEIYVDGKATIGGALAYRELPWGMPAEIGEKMQSIWRATCRKAAELGGHQSIIAEGMVDEGIALRIVEKDGRPFVEEGQGPRMLKRKGRILTMTAREAVDCGLAKDVVSDYDALGGKLGLAGWKKTSQASELAFDKHKKELDQAVEQLQKLEAAFQEELRRTHEILSAPVGSTKRKEAAAHVLNAMSAVKQVQDLAKKFPQLNLSGQSLGETIRQLGQEREQLLRDN